MYDFSNGEKSGGFWQTGMRRLGSMAIALVVFLSMAATIPGGARADEESTFEPVVPISQKTARMLKEELGISILYVFGFNRKGVQVVGVTEGKSTVEMFDNQFDLWKAKRRIEMREIRELSVVRFVKNPEEQCFPYPFFGSIFWYCITPR
jgi:hypothetical protein